MKTEEKKKAEKDGEYSLAAWTVSNAIFPSTTTSRRTISHLKRPFSNCVTLNDGLKWRCWQWYESQTVDGACAEGALGPVVML